MALYAIFEWKLLQTFQLTTRYHLLGPELLISSLIWYYLIRISCIYRKNDCLTIKEHTLCRNLYSAFKFLTRDVCCCTVTNIWLTKLMASLINFKPYYMHAKLKIACSVFVNQAIPVAKTCCQRQIVNVRGR